MTSQECVLYTVVPAQDFALLSKISSLILLNSSTYTSIFTLYFLDPDEHKLEIHVGNWQDRINAKKADPGNWKNVEWFV